MEDAAKQKVVKDRDPLEPLSSLIRLLMGLLVVGFGFVIVATLFGSGSILGWGRASVCVGTTHIGFGTTDGSLPFIRPHAKVGVNAEGLRLCADSPSGTQRWWFTLEQLPSTVTVLAVAVTTYLILRHAERHGLYAPGVARRIHFLGWFLIADSVLRPAVEIISKYQLWVSMADSSAPIEWNIIWTFLFAGLALLSLARIMRVGSGMQEELQGVV